MVEQVEMNDRITGFVLKQSDYREADVILSVLTKSMESYLLWHRVYAK